MFRYIARRLLLGIPVLLGVSTLVFAILHLTPGDPVELMLAQSGVGQRASVDELRHQLGLDLPLPVQYVRFLGNAVHGDFGDSIFMSRPVGDLIREQLPATLQLALAGLLVAVVVGIPLGVVAAVKAGTWIDDLAALLSLVGVSMPSFWFGLLLIFLFSLRLGWLPATGQGGLERLVMPALVLGLWGAAIVARIVRSSMLDVIGQDFMNTARAKGAGARTVIWRHAMKNALIPVITIVGLQFGQLLGGAVVTETVFARQGIGRLAVSAVITKDFPLVQGTVLLAAVVYLIANIIVDVLYAVVDPRVRYG
jgi:ABC-type dipeptide/oligopeptide/nickel transport system permease component